jgi:hypothetical protein
MLHTRAAPRLAAHSAGMHSDEYPWRPIPSQPLLSALLQGFITHSFRGSQGIISALEFHPDPKRLWLFSAASADCHVRVWDLFAKKYAIPCRADPHLLLDLPFPAYRKY